MNQILSTSIPNDDRKKKNKVRNTQPMAIGSILKLFAIVTLVFGVFMAGTGVFAIYKNQSNEEQKSIEPTISLENKTDTTVLLKIVHPKIIAKVEYGWNDEEKTVISGNNGKYLEEEIDIPSGTNTLHVIIEDEDGEQVTYEKQYEIESNINFEVSGNKIKITYNGDTNVSYMTYRWDEEDEETIQINGTSINEEIEAIKGLHTLTVVVVDENNNTDTKSKKINGVSKPQITINVDNEQKHFIIKASDDELLSKIEFKLNNDDEQEYFLNLESLNTKEYEYILQMELQNGNNLIEVKVYNADGVVSEESKTVVK